MEEGVEGLLRDMTRKSGTPPVPEEKVRKLAELAPTARKTENWGILLRRFWGILLRH